MGLDIKIPIGLMFTILGILLTIHGIVQVGIQRCMNNLSVSI